MITTPVSTSINLASIRITLSIIKNPPVRIYFAPKPCPIFCAVDALINPSSPRLISLSKDSNFSRSTIWRDFTLDRSVISMSASPFEKASYSFRFEVLSK